ncbi:MAG: hypothetical protein PHR68_05610, partial [Candidatus Gracilibacteria bacterium]|nr:hypothetical protein [Candidatus Gracilibacteria bacterium]
QTVSYEDLYAYINENSLEVFMEDKEDKPDEVKDVKRGFSIGKAWMKFYSVSDIVTGLAMLPKTIEESLKRGNSIKSAQFALAFGGLLPDSIKLQLQSNVEAQEKKEMETLIGKWSVLDSKDFIPLLKKIILNASSEEYEKEAAMVFFLQKYGVLYGKGFKELKGSFIWYKAMGGTPNDATYKEYKKYCLDGKIPFTEEGLIETLLTKQATGELKPKRRSKFAKDYGGYIKKGIADEKDDGEKKAGALLTTEGRINYAIGELQNGTYHNGIGSLKKIWEKGGTAKEMYTIPFLMTASGASQSLTQDALNDYHSLSFTRVFSAIQFSKTQDDINLYNRVILKLANSIGQDAYKKLDGALKESAEHEKIAELNKVWGEYGDQMIKKLNINEDPEIFLKKDEDSDFKLYYEKIGKVYGDTGFQTNKGDLQDGVYNHNHSSPFSFLGKKYLDKFVSIDPQTGSIKGDDGKIVFRNTIAGYKNIAKLKINEEEKKKIFEFYYDSIAGRLSSTYSRVLAKDSRLFELENASGSGLLKEMKKDYGILLFQGHNAKGKTKKEFLEERWQDYKNRYMYGNTTQATKNDVLKERENIFGDVENILAGKNKKKGIGEQTSFSENQTNTSKKKKKKNK